MRVFRKFLWLWTIIVAGFLALSIIAESAAWFGGLFSFLITTPLCIGGLVTYIHWVLTTKLGLTKETLIGY